MVYKKSIVDNELMKAVIAIRIDTLWKMIVQKSHNRLPEINEEGATGKFDNKGAIFIPGGLVYQDVDEQIVQYERRSGMSGSEFRDRVRSAMRFDNATLLYPDGLAPSINLDNGFFSKAARQILTYKKAAYRRKKKVLKPEDRCAEHAGSSFALVLRVYAPTNPGKRSKNHLLEIISPKKDLNLDTNQIEAEARKRYGVT